MFSRIFSRIVGRGRGFCGSTSPRRQRPARRIAAAAGQAIDALESRVLLSTLYVDASAPGPTYNGSSWTTAYKDLQLALSASAAGDEIRIADGTYKPTSTTDRTISFALRDGVAIHGGYAGYGAADPDARDVALYPTILSGDIGTAFFADSFHVLTAVGVGPLTVLAGVAVTGGYANGSDPNGYGSGGGLFASGASPTLIDCTFSGNTAANSGGGMYNCDASSPTLVNCTFSGNSSWSFGGGMRNSSSSSTLVNCNFSGNSAGVSGGGMFNSLSSPMLTDCTFSANSVSSSLGYSTDGGGMSNASSSPILTNCTFVDNSATGGGGIYNASSSPMLIHCNFSGNRATGGGMYNNSYNSTASPTLTECTFSGNSSGMYNYAASPMLTDCTFNGNSGVGMSNNSASSPMLVNCVFSGNSGGGMHNKSSSSPMLNNCIFSGNSSLGGSGGMHNNSSSPTLINCTFIGNSAIAFASSNGSGGGMYNDSSSPKLTNCAFSRNSASSYGGGIYNSSASSPMLANCTFSGNSANFGGGLYHNSSSATLTLINCIVWGNSASSGAQIQRSSGTVTITFSDIQGGYAGIGNIDADPLFVRSAWAGPDGLYGTADDDPGDLRLRTGSPALDIGSNAAVSGVGTDLAGNARIQNGTVDLGAYEGPGTGSAPKILYVDAAAGGANTGVSWANALTSLQSALAAAQDGDTIRVADGTYKPASSTDRGLSFALRNGVAIYGGYAGSGASDPDARDIALYPTVLSGDIGTAGSSADNSYHVLTASGVGASASLDGVTVSGGNANGSGWSQSWGGGLFSAGAALTLINCTFSGNSASSCGGGMYNASSSPALINCTVSGNFASTSGGGMYNASSSPALINCTVSGNFASTSGGGMYNYSSSPKLTNCIVWGNGNGAIYNSSSTPVIACSDIQGGYTGSGNINADPLFVRSPWTGPDGLFGTADDDAGDLRLRAGSPALNVGSNTAISGISTDLAGNARIQNGNVDLGAYEGSTAAPAPKNLYVDGAATGTNTGTSWANAFTSLSSALAAASDGDTLRIADGTYRPTSTTNRTLGFALRNAVAIHGGHAGHGASDPDARDIALYPTVLSGDIGTAGSSADNSYHVLTASGVGASTVLDGVTVTRGNANGSGSSGYGGGLLVVIASPTLVNCTFSQNSANSGGGVYHSATSLPTLTACTFSGNSAGTGGGMYNASSSSPTLANCAFSGNSAESGGGIYNDSPSSAKLTNCAFSGNSASSYGGGVYNGFSSSLALNNCTFGGNSAYTGGGMYIASSSSANLTSCAFSGNSASRYGGGVYNASSTTLINCAFSGNSAIVYGGGMYNDVSSPKVINCAFSANSASSSGGGMYNKSSSPTMTNCILWGNTAGNGPQIYASGGAAAVTHGDVQGGHAGTGNINADPLFVRNPSPGPDGLWNGINDDYGDLRLQPASPCIDHGNNAATGLAAITTDLAGKLRFVDIPTTPDGGMGTPPIVDMGAYEAQWACPAWLDPAGVGVWDAGDYSLDIGSGVLTVAADDGNRGERLEAIRQAVALGRSVGAGIVSSAATEDRGVIAAVDGEGNILVRLALIGDVTLDDRLDGDDYFAMDTAFLASAGTFQPAADLNVDGTVDGRDYLMLDLRFLRSATAAIEPSAPLLPVAQAAQQPPAAPFSTQTIANELLLEEDSVLLTAR